MSDAALLFLKLVGILLTGIFGIYGLFATYKSPANQITKHCYYALILVALSTLVAFAAQVLQSDRDQTERDIAASRTLEAVKRSEAILKKIDRSLYPIRDVSVGFSIAVPTDQISLSAYVKRFTEAADELIKKRDESNAIFATNYPATVTNGVFEWAENIKGYTEGFSYGSGSVLAPNHTIAAEKIADFVFSKASVELKFFRQPMDFPNHFGIDTNPSQAPDLRFTVTTRLSSPDAVLSHIVHYTKTNSDFQLVAVRAPTDLTSWINTQEIISVMDLVGSQLIITFPRSALSDDKNSDEKIQKIRSRLKLNGLCLTMSDGRNFILRETNLTRLPDQDGSPVYAFYFPQTFEELKGLEY